MTHIINFLKSIKLESNDIFIQLKCTEEEVKILQYITSQYIKGNDNLIVINILSEFYDIKQLEHLSKLSQIKNLLELGWIVQSSFNHVKLSEIAQLELINSTVTLSGTFLKLLEDGSLDLVLPEITPYTDHLEYLQDQFFKISLAKKLNVIKHNFAESSPNINRLKSKLIVLENRIKDRIKTTTTPIMLEEFFKEHKLEDKEQMIFIALLKEEYSRSDDSIRDMNMLTDLVSNDDYEKIKHRSLLEESSNLISKNLIDYDEMLTPFGGIGRNFYIPDQILYKISHPTKKPKRKQKIKLQTLINEQEMFELIEPKRDLKEIVLNQKNEEILKSLLKHMDKDVVNLLKQWNIKDKKKGIDARIIFYGPSGTGKTVTALALAGSLKKQILSFDCSKILSMYIGESEKNVRKIFDDYKELALKTKSEPVLLLNEADQFLSNRSQGDTSSGDKMHNQMQNIFLEQIENFDGILIATTNLLDNIDKAFSRRFNYKLEFTKPNEKQRLALWDTLLPVQLPLSTNFDKTILSKYELTGGQIELVIKNTAYKVAVNKALHFTIDDFIGEIKKEQQSMFDRNKKVGFLG
ncbi:Cell division protein FtsH [hydrothermal vent metagenome]|uniref:Cell division protein FtsH n=1 Tax=hydrothermal vent metagenome TaxID=652676 RepID=A0A3B1E6A6_9ZZZZ